MKWKLTYNHFRRNHQYSVYSLRRYIYAWWVLFVSFFLSFQGQSSLFLVRCSYDSLATQHHLLLSVSDSATPWTVACQAPLSMGILQARILERVAMPSSRGPSQPKDRMQVSCTASGFFTVWATREAQILILTNQESVITKHF